MEAKDEVSALARGLALLRAIADARRPLSNRELADRCAIPKATVSRLTGTLQSAGLLRQEPDERLALGAGLLHLGNAYLQSFDFRQQVRGHLQELAEAVGCNVQLGVRDGLDMVLIESMRPRTAVILSNVDVGSRMPIARSAMGRAFLAALPASEQAVLHEALLAAPAEPGLQERLQAALHEHERHGFCSSYGEWHPEIHALGFSLQGLRGERYAVSVGGPAYRLPAQVLVEQIAPRMLETKRLIESEAGVSTAMPRT